MKRFFVLAHELARRNAQQAVLEAPTGYVVEIKPKNRTLEQNAKIHALIQDISREVVWANKVQTVETWKRLLTAAWLRARGEPVEMLPAIDGHGVDIVFRPTSKLTVEEMSEFIEYIQAWAAEQGIVIND
jgi:hypothetical protein